MQDIFEEITHLFIYQIIQCINIHILCIFIHWSIDSAI